jgi:predicted branched-subunit amino acid permease
MDGRTLLFELLMAGFFAVACIRAHGPVESGHKLTFGEFFHLLNRLERLIHTRWQWISMVGLLLVIRMQQPIPLGLEIMVAAQFVIFLALPVRAVAKGGVRSR